MALQTKEATYNSTVTKKESVKAHPFQQSFSIRRRLSITLHPPATNDEEQIDIN